MLYAFLLYAEEDVVPSMDEAEHQELFAAYAAFNQMVEEAGVFVGAERLHATTQAATARGQRNGAEVSHTDGPFAETKEALAGFYLLECKTLDEARSWAERIPGVRIGAVEIRPVMGDPMVRE